MTQVFLNSALSIAAMMVSVWLISVFLKDVSIVDLAWGAGFALVAWATFLTQHGDGPASWLLPTLATIWAMRLTGYLAWRNLGHPEDKRYQAMRARRGKSFVFSSLFIVFGLQGAIMFVVALPLQVGISQSSGGWNVFHFVGCVLWLTGFLFESVGDWQLARFKSRPENAGRVMDRGLWRWTRHPNYFGDFLVWWGFFVVAISEGQAAWTIIGPVVMSFFLMKVSGVPMLEKSLTKTRPGYAEYIRNTNAFFPWRPRTSTSAGNLSNSA